MKNYPQKIATLCQLKLILVVCSLILGVFDSVIAQTGDSKQHHTSNDSTLLIAQKAVGLEQEEQEKNAFFTSKYTYCDAQLLSNYWGQSLEETKARIGRKIGWGERAITYLEQFLLDARTQAIKEGNTQCSYADHGYTYEDAVALARFWGESSPYQAKLRINLNLTMGNQEQVDLALEEIGRR